MSLLKQQGLPVYKPEQGFKYPWAMETFEQHDRMVWFKHEYSLTKDVQHYNKGSEKERDDINKIMKLFVQNDVMAETGYETMLRIFKPTEVKLMLGSFLAREGTHVFNYANFVDTVGLPTSTYTEFLEIPVMSVKTEYMEKAKVKKYEDYKAMGLTDSALDKEFRRDVARMLAVYAGGLEGVSLMAQFAMLLQFQFQGKYPGLCTIVEWSIKDETMHLLGNTQLFRAYISENQDIWDDELKYDIYQAFREIVAYEHALIDYIDPAHMSNESLKRYVEYCADNALSHLGMKRNWHTTVNPLEFMDDVVGSVLTDFFSGSVTEYTNSVQGEWENIDYSHWQKELENNGRKPTD